MVPRNDPGAEARAEEVAAYVATIARDLKGMAERSRLEALGYLLELVRLEAEARASDGVTRVSQSSSRRSNG